MTGLVKLYRQELGYGFIQPLIGRPESAADVFFHISQCPDEVPPPKGAEVRFDLVRGVNGVQAANIQVLKVKSGALLKEGEENG